MWEQVKPITMLLEQENDDGSRFVLHLFSHDFELIKVRDAFEYNSKNEYIYKMYNIYFCPLNACTFIRCLRRIRYFC